MGNLTSRHWEEMTELQEATKENQQEEVKERRSFRDKFRTKVLRTDPRSATEGVDRTPIAVEKQGGGDFDTPLQVKTLSLVDPRSPGAGGGVDRTPIVVEEGVRRRVLTEECDTPVRGRIPPSSLTIPVPADGIPPGRSPLLIDNGEDDPRSPSTLSPRTPITSTPAIDLITRHSSEHSTPATVELPGLEEKARVKDQGQPSQILQNRFKAVVASSRQHSDTPATPAAAGEMDDSDLSIKSSNDASLVI